MKGKIIIKLLLLLASIIAFYFLSVHINKNKADANKKQASLLSDINRIKSQTSHLLNKEGEIKASLETWRELKGDNLSFKGISISKVKSILDLLKNRHNIVKIETQMSKPIDLKKEYASGKFVTQSSTVTLKIYSHTDVKVLLFVEDLVQNFGKYIKISSLSISNSVLVTQSFYVDLAKDISITPITAEIIFDWRELKDLES
jgi:hypothetical protein